MAELSLDPSKTALLVMDVQNDQVGRVREAGQLGNLLENVRRAIDAARRAGMPVIYVVARFRKGHPEAHPRNPFQMWNKQMNRLVEGTPEAEIHEAVAPLPDDIVVTKRRVNAFFNTDLSTVLGAKGVDTLVLTGIATSGVVLATVRYAADADYGLVVLEDCCADQDAEVHSVLMRKVFPRQATVATLQDFLAALGA